MHPAKTQCGLVRRHIHALASVACSTVSIFIRIYERAGGSWCPEWLNNALMLGIGPDALVVESFCFGIAALAFAIIGLVKTRRGILDGIFEVMVLPAAIGALACALLL